MGEVVYLPASRQAAEQRRGAFFDLGQWRVSRRGNAYTRIGEFCVTVYPAWNGFKFAIAATARDRPTFPGRSETGRVAGATRMVDKSA